MAKYILIHTCQQCFTPEWELPTKWWKFNMCVPIGGILSAGTHPHEGDAFEVLLNVPHERHAIYCGAKKYNFFQAKDLEDEMASTFQPPAKDRKNLVLITTCDWRSKYPSVHICIVKSWCVLWCGLLPSLLMQPPIKWCFQPDASRGAPPRATSQVGHFKVCTPLPPSQVGHFKGGTPLATKLNWN